MHACAHAQPQPHTHGACIFKSRRWTTRAYHKSSDRNCSEDQIFKRYEVGMRRKVSEEPEERGAGVGSGCTGRAERENMKAQSMAGTGLLFHLSKMLSEIPLGSPTDFFILFSPLSLMFFFPLLLLSLVLEAVKDGALTHTHSHTHRNMYPHIFPHFPAMVGLLTPKEGKKKKKGGKRRVREKVEAREKKRKEAAGRAGDWGRAGGIFC